MKYLLIGGAGFIGGHLISKIKKEDTQAQITVVDNLATGRRDTIPDDVEFKLIDVRSILHQLKGFYDYYFNAAAEPRLPHCQLNPGRAISVNVEGVANSLEHARLNGCKKYVLFSTSAVYECTKDSPLIELLEPHPRLVYAQTKLMAERLVLGYKQVYGLPVAIPRIFNVYGSNFSPRQQPALVGYLIKTLLDKQRPVLYNNGVGARDYIYVKDLCDLLWKMAIEPTDYQPILNACSGVKYSVSKIYKVIRDYLAEKRDIYTGEPELRPPEEYWKEYENGPKGFQTGAFKMLAQVIKDEVNKDVLGSNTLAWDILKWRPQYSLEQGMKETIEETLCGL